MDSGIREIFARRIRNLGFWIWNTAQGIRNPNDDWYPESKFLKGQRIRNSRRRIQNPRQSWISLWGDTQGLHCKYRGELHTIPYNFVIRNCMELLRRLFFISLGAADFVTYDHREVFFPTPFCQENVIIWKQTRHDRVGRPKPAKIKGFSSSISEASFVSIWSKIRFLGCR